MAMLREDRKRAASGGDRVAPPKAGEAREVAIGGDQLAAGLDRERGEERVGDEVPTGAAVAAGSNEQIPVALTRRESDGVGSGPKHVGERERVDRGLQPRPIAGRSGAEERKA